MARFFLFSLLILLTISESLVAQIPNVTGWRVHLPYREPNSVVEVGDKIYVGSKSGLFTFNRSDKSIERISTVNGLSEIEVDIVGYNRDLDILLVAYENTNIDLIEQGVIYNVGDIERTQILGEKRINHIYMQGKLAYLSCTFGIVVIDLERKETSASYLNLGPGGTDISISSLTILNDTIYACTEVGIISAPLSSPNLNDFGNWDLFVNNPVNQHIASFNNRLYANIDSVTQVYDGGQWQVYDDPLKRQVVNIDVFYDQLLIAQDNGVYLESLTGDRTFVTTNAPGRSILDNENDIWFAKELFGLIRVNRPSNTLDFYKPNGPFGKTAGKMAAIDNELWVSSTNINTLWGPQFNNFKFYQFTDDKWVNYSTLTTPGGIDTLFDLNVVAIDPLTNTKYFGSFGDGLLAFNNENDYIIYDDNNSTLDWWEVTADFRLLQVAGLAFDERGNLWVSNYGAPEPISVRKRDGTWISYGIRNLLGTENELGAVVIDDFGQKWIQSPKGNGILVFNDNNTIENKDDDQVRLLNTTVGNGALPGDEVLSMARDLDGEIWVGTNTGLTVFFNPSAVFRGQDFDAQQIIVGDANSAAYLLGEEVVTAIKVDPANRKWIGTRNGVWLVSDDGNEVIYNFTTENSPLISNNIIEIEINTESGEVFFATDKGIISFVGTATKGDDVHGDVFVFPNPVRENYDGLISIRGLVNDANVKITDINGNLIYETTANGGTATWNGKSFSGRKAQTGVYLIFSANEDGTESLATKVLVVN